MATLTAAEPNTAGTDAVSRSGGLARALRSSPSGFIGITIVVVMILIAVIGPFFTPEQAADVNSILLPSGSPGHLLGTDNEGSDVLNSIINGGAPVIFVGFAAA